MSKLIDMSLRTGVFSGDLRYGRRNGSITVKGKDYIGDNNTPVVPLQLVKARDLQMWSKDNRVKQVRSLPNSQHAINTIIDVYSNSNLKSNISLTVGKQRM